MRTGEYLLAAATLWRESSLSEEDPGPPGTPDVADDSDHSPESLRSIWVSASYFLEQTVDALPAAGDQALGNPWARKAND